MDQQETLELPAIHSSTDIAEQPTQILPAQRPLNESRLWLSFITLCGIILRVYQFPHTPAGLNQDEANAGYEAFSLLHTGADKWGYHLPAYFVSFGSGQNVLQSYLSVPIVALFGLHVFSIRLIPLLLGILTIPLAYAVGAKLYDKQTGLLAAALVATVPWHIMLSRWALESDILPFFLLLGIYTFVCCVEKPELQWLIPFSLVPFAFALYAYAISIFMLPFLLLFLVVMYRREIIEQRWRFLIGGGVFFVLALPMLLFFLVNYLLNSEPSWLANSPISIPLLPMSRLAEVSQGPIGNLGANLNWIGHGFNDGLSWNSYPGIWPLGVITIPGAIAGCYFSVKDKAKRYLIPILWLLSTLPLFVTSPLNVNRGNSIFLPLLLLCAFGIRRSITSIRGNKALFYALIAFIGISFAYNFVFSYDYFTNQNNITSGAFNVDFNIMLDKAQKKQHPGEIIYITKRMKFNYVYTIFYTQADPHDFQAHVVYTINPISNLFEVQQYRNFVFDPNVARLKQVPSYLYITKRGERISCAHLHTLFEQGQWALGRCTST